MITVITVLIVLIGIIGLTILTLQRIDKADEAAYQRMTNHGRLADQFRADVAQAVSAPEQWGQFQAGKHCLILALDKTTFIVYQRDKQGLERRYFQGDKKESQRLSIGKDEVEFVRADPRLLKMRITADEGARAHYPNEIAAALGGERR